MIAIRPPSDAGTASRSGRRAHQRPREVQIITASADIAAVQEEWLDFLRERANGHDFAQHPDVVRYDLEENRDIFQPMIVIVRNAGRIEAVAPWHIHRLRFPLKMGVKNLTRVPLRLFKLAGGGMSLDRDAPSHDLLDLIFDVVYQQRSQFDLVALFDMPVPGYLWDYLETMTAKDRRFRKVAITAEPLTHLRIQLPDTFDDFMASLTSKKRNSLKKHERDLRQATSDTVELISVTSPEQVGPFFEQVRTIYEMSWQGQTMGDERGTETQIRYNTMVAAHGWLRCHLLRSADGPICYSLGYRYGDAFYCHDMAYDPEYRKCAPGNFMFLNIIKDLYERDTPRVVDFGAGDSVFKQQFSNDAGKSQTVYLVPAGRHYGRTVITTQRLMHRAYVRISALLTRMGIDRWVRERIKRRGAPRS